MRFYPLDLELVLNGDDVQEELERKARTIVAKARGSKGTSKMSFRTRSGKSRRGAFAQAIMYGDGAVSIEFGSRNNPPFAPLRRAMR